MCKAFSCIATRKKVYWKCGIDSHNDIVDYFKLKDNGTNNFIPIEITPENNNYIEPDEWILKFDDICPDWWKQSHEQMCWSALGRWKKEVYSKIHKNRIKNIIHPFKLPMVKEPTNIDINNLKRWALVRNSVKVSVENSVLDSIRDSVGDSVRASVRASVWASVRASVWASVWASIWDSVWASIGNSIGNSVENSAWASIWDSIWDSVWAYLGFMFKLQRNEWRYTDDIKCKEYPFMPLIKLWKRGIVPSFDGKIWRLHSGKNAKIIFEITDKERSR